jgi:hypothetical protein
MTFAELLAHGGTGGVILEAALVVSIAAVFVAIWLRTRRDDQGEDAGD